MRAYGAMTAAVGKHSLAVCFGCLLAWLHTATATRVSSRPRGGCRTSGNALAKGDGHRLNDAGLADRTNDHRLRRLLGHSCAQVRGAESARSHATISLANVSAAPPAVVSTFVPFFSVDEIASRQSASPRTKTTVAVATHPQPSGRGCAGPSSRVPFRGWCKRENEWEGEELV